MIDPAAFRNVLAAYPTGVVVITAVEDGGPHPMQRHGLVIGSFTSISLDPPLVGFFPDRNSRSWAKMAPIGRFCVNVLGADQLALCRRFAGRADDKFADLAHGHSPSGQPVLENAIAWIDCVIERVIEVGDHFLVVGAVESLGRGDGGNPLLFFGGQYHNLVELPGSTAGK